MVDCEICSLKEICKYADEDILDEKLSSLGNSIDLLTSEFPNLVVDIKCKYYNVPIFNTLHLTRDNNK